MDKNVNPESRDYSFDLIEDDPRMKRTTKEFFITMSVYLIYAILMITNLFTLGRHSVDFPKVLGFPLWIFVLICLIVGMVVTVELITTFVYKDMELSDKIPDTDAEVAKEEK